VQPEEVLELMRSAPERYDTVRAALRYTGDGSTIKAVRERFLRSEAGRRTFGGPPEPFEAAHHSEPDGPFGTGRSAGGFECGGRTSTAGGRNWSSPAAG
jgi:hypothetical protein